MEDSELFDMSDYTCDYLDELKEGCDLLDDIYDCIIEFSRSKKLSIGKSPYYHIRRPQFPMTTYPYTTGYPYASYYSNIYNKSYLGENFNEKSTEKYGKVEFDNNYSVKYKCNFSSQSRASLVVSLLRYDLPTTDKSIGIEDYEIFCNKDELLEIIKRADYKYMDTANQGKGKVKKNIAKDIKIYDRFNSQKRRESKEELPNYSYGYRSNDFSLRKLWKNINNYGYNNYHHYTDFDIYD